MVGLALFAGLFLLLEGAPRRLRGLFELTIAAKVALPVCGATFLRGATGARDFILVARIVAAALILAYLLLAGWAAAPIREGRPSWPRSTSPEHRSTAGMPAV